tara:strand:+ start:734 stop:1198 length:465 start_codon:yes stop_codon:yes gene_type:complete
MDTAQRGAALTAIASGYKSQNILSPDHDVVGVAGEQAVATMFGVAMPDPIPTGRGDGGRDLPDIAGYPPDVKTARKPGHLPVVVGKLDRRTLYILCGYSDETKLATVLCWQWGSVVEDYGWIGKLCPRSPESHNLPRAKCRPIAELLEQHNKRK